MLKRAEDRLKSKSSSVMEKIGTTVSMVKASPLGLGQHCERLAEFLLEERFLYFNLFLFFENKL
ncbi:hypothetical protein [Legionella tucsonensis]|uniref:Uncharacterized protein n=1 Tax=Legionella tucsonensis TaxID=40335 RepID=A0A0W0ZXL7_9GAMM|nr:hypothetical protein [Legionella tucsonensis]KTD73766.1 hypothetical protein Ltuc_1613 [Legionella tucsonensis]